MTVEDAVRPPKSSAQTNNQASSKPGNPRSSPVPPLTPLNHPIPGSPAAGHVTANSDTRRDNQSFEWYQKHHPVRANKCLNQLQEITNITEQKLLIEAFNRTRGNSRGDFGENIPVAIEWLLEYVAKQEEVEKRSRLSRSAPIQDLPTAPLAKRQLQLQIGSGDNESFQTMPPAVAMNRSEISAGITQPPNSPNQSKPLVDLTDNGNNANNANNASEADLQKAIKLSLQDAPPNYVGSTFSQEDQDVSRALEASLMESQMIGAKRKRGDTWVDPLNPHDRERNGLWPVGLKNVGSTCWFSAVIQSLFYLPVFRNLVLNFQSSKLVRAAPNGLKGQWNTDGDKAQKVVLFMTELRKLFSLMLASERKYVDPTNAVDILRGFIGSSSNVSAENQQEDVSEFTHVLFAWMEEAFKTPKVTTTEPVTKDEKMDEDESNESKDNRLLKDDDEVTLSDSEEKKALEEDCSQENPMAKLFYGRIQVEGNHQGKSYVRTEAFTQHSLQVQEVNNLHDSLENSTANETFGSANSQERWFTDLPPVLLFSLSRFNFDVTKGMAEKIHNRFEFPDRLFMDRYLDINKAITRTKREQVRQLKSEREQLDAKLQKFVNYGSSESKIPLPTLLQYTMDYASASGEQTDVSMGSPSEGITTTASTTHMQVDSPCPSPKITPSNSLTNVAAAVASATTGTSRDDNNIRDDFAPMDVEMGEEDQAEDLAGCENSKGNKVGKNEIVCPKHVSEMEFRVLQTCLSRWKAEVLSDIASLEKSIRVIDESIESMYSEASLEKREYRLHAVLVHEGSVNSGHYWAYVYDHKRQVWLKFNDNSVTEADYEELKKESFGGHSNASAYSLIYVEGSKVGLILDAATTETSDDNMEHEVLESLIRGLPNDLAEYVVKDNKSFEDERLRWDQGVEERRRREEASKLDGDSKADLQVVREKLTYVNTHAKLCAKQSLQRIMNQEKQTPNRTANPAVLNAIVDQTMQYYKTRQEYEKRDGHDIRLESFVQYLVKNESSDVVIRLAVLEQFCLPGLQNESQFAASVKQLAESTLLQIRDQYPQESQLLKDWHQAYHNFRVSAHCFVSGVEEFIAKDFEEALDHMAISYHLNIRIAENPPAGHYKSLQIKPVLKYLRLSLLEVNKLVVARIKTGEKMAEVTRLVEQLILPVLSTLHSRVNRECSRSNEVASSSSSPFPGSSSVASKCLEEVRNLWCDLLGEEDMELASKNFVSEHIQCIIEPPAKNFNDSSRHCEHIDQERDFQLTEDYFKALQRLHEEGTAANV